MSGTFRKDYRPMKQDEINLVEDIKSAAENLEEFILMTPPSRERSLAITKLEEAVMWAGKGITA